MTTKRYIVGIDAGGTGVRAALGDRDTGEILAQREGPSDPGGGPEPLLQLIGSLLGEIPRESIAAVLAGITKVSRAGVKDGWETYLCAAFPDAAAGCVPDYVIAFHGALPDGVGLAVIAGTGSVVYGENIAGQSTRVGGRGWEFGDEGSGAWLTTEMVRRTLRALDGMENATTLTGEVCQFLGTQEAASLGESARRFALESGRGFLAPLALALAQSGEQEATNLFVGAGGWLAAQVRAAAQRLEMRPTGAFRVATIGGLWSAGRLLSEPFTSVLRRSFPEAKIVEPDGPPLTGAVRMARRLAEGKVPVD